MSNSKLYIGTCSWKYDSWRGIVYSDSAKINYLEEYSTHYNSVEIDQWFWSLNPPDKVSLPKPSDIKLYNESTPDDFRFTIKVPNSITLTHFYNRKKTDSLLKNPFFLSAEIFNKLIDLLSPVHNKIGMLMFQFEYLNKQKMSGLPEFMDRLAEFVQQLPSGFNYGIEIRNPNYLTEKYFRFIEDFKLCHVFLEGYYMPSVVKLYQTFGKYINTNSVIRLHGPDRDGIEKITENRWDKIVIPRDQDILLISEMIALMQKKCNDLFINVNNHYEGSAPLTIEKIKNNLR